MKNIMLVGIALVMIVTGCSTAQKAASTPDDVYYSPAPETRVYAEDRYEATAANNDDNYLRMKVNNRYQWAAIDDYSYWNDSRYDFGYSCFPSRQVLLNPNTPYGAWSFGFYYSPWGSFYNPCYTVVYYSNPKAYYGSTSKTNLTAFSNNRYYTGSSNKANSGSLFKSLFNSNNSSEYNTNTPARSFSSGSTLSNSAGGRSGGFNSTRSSGSISRPSRPPM